MCVTPAIRAAMLARARCLWHCVGACRLQVLHRHEQRCKALAGEVAALPTELQRAGEASQASAHATLLDALETLHAVRRDVRLML